MAGLSLSPGQRNFFYSALYGVVTVVHQQADTQGITEMAQCGANTIDRTEEVQSDHLVVDTHVQSDSAITVYPVVSTPDVGNFLRARAYTT